MFERDQIRRFNSTCHEYKDGELVFDYIGNRVIVELRTDGDGKNLYLVLWFNLPVTFDYHTSNTVTVNNLELIPVSMFDKTPESEAMSELIGEDAGTAVMKLLEMVTEDYYISATRLRVFRTSFVAKESDDGWHHSGIMFTYHYKNKFYIILHADGDHKFLMFTLALPSAMIPPVVLTPIPTKSVSMKDFLFDLSKVKSTISKEVVVYLTAEIVEFDNPKLKRTEKKAAKQKEVTLKTEGFETKDDISELIDKLVYHLRSRLASNNSLTGEVNIKDLYKLESTSHLMKQLIRYKEYNREEK